MPHGKTILLLGAQGLYGRFTALSLAQAGYQVLRGGRRPEQAADFRLVDLDRIETFVAALDGVDLVVNSVEDLELRAEREVLQRGGILLSQASLPAATRRRLASMAGAGSKGTVVINSGLTGVVGLVARDLLDRHPHADTVEIGYVASITASAGLGGLRYAHRVLTTGSALPTVQCEFSPPGGLRTCFDVSANDELWTSKRLTEERKVHAFVCLAERWVMGILFLLNRLRLLSRLPEAGFTFGLKLKPPPRELTREPIRARVAVRRDAELLEARGIDAEGDYNASVQATTVFATALLEAAGAQGLPKGAHNVEDLFRFEQLRTRLAEFRQFVRPLVN